MKKRPIGRQDANRRGWSLIKQRCLGPAQAFPCPARCRGREDVPDDLKADLEPDAQKPPPLQSYIPPDPSADKALNVALELLRTSKDGVAARPTKRAGVPN
jgi:hypothetical protein